MKPTPLKISGNITLCLKTFVKSRRFISAPVPTSNAHKNSTLNQKDRFTDTFILWCVIPKSKQFLKLCLHKNNKRLKLFELVKYLYPYFNKYYASIMHIFVLNNLPVVSTIFYTSLLICHVVAWHLLYVIF